MPELVSGDLGGVTEGIVLMIQGAVFVNSLAEPA
jgi:hypothetical protein